MLEKLIPVPGNNVLHPEIADFYIKDDADVASAKKEFDNLYRKALSGDPAAALAVAVIEGNDNDLGAAVDDLSDALEDYNNNEDDNIVDIYDAVVLETSRKADNFEDLGAAVDDLSEALEDYSSNEEGNIGDVYDAVVLEA